MSDELKPPDFTQAQQLILALNDARQKEIEVVRGRIEDFLKSQLEIKHEMEIVAKGQENLKERFEMGVSKTLFELNKKFDTFMMDWGRKQMEDELRDKRIKDVDDKADAADKRAEGAFKSAEFYGKAILGTLLGSLVFAGITYMISKLHG